MDSSSIHTDGNGKKLRSTCDRCAALKVRCNKQKPKCERCETSQEKCVYGPYRWKGRPASNKTAAALQQQRKQQQQQQASHQQQQLPTPPPQLPHPHPPLHLPTSNTSSPAKFMVSPYSQPPETPNVYIEPTDMQAYSGWDDLQLPQGFGPLGFELGQPWTSPPTQIPVDLDFVMDAGIDNSMLMDSSGDMSKIKPNGVGDFHDNILYPHPSGPSTPSFDLNQGFFASPTPSGASIPPSGSHECRSLVMELLQGLSQLTPRCDPAGAEPSYFSSTRLMKVNRSAIQTLDRILDRRCPSCLLGGELPLLLRSECSIMLGRYRDVFRSIAGVSESGISSSSSSSSGISLSRSPSLTPPDVGTPRSIMSGHHHSRSESISFDPFQFNDFKLDYLSERTTNAHLLLGELRKLDRVLDKIRGVEKDAHPPEPTAQLIGGVQDAFNGFLEASMADLKSQIEQFCIVIA